jgi:hypothetical protein
MISLRNKLCYTVAKEGKAMGHTFQTSDEQYEKLAAYAAQQGQTPEMLFEEWLSTITRDTEKLPSVKNTKPAERDEQTGREEEVLSSPLLDVAGMFAICESGWADRHDEYVAETYLR